MADKLGDWRAILEPWARHFQEWVPLHCPDKVISKSGKVHMESYWTQWKRAAFRCVMCKNYLNMRNIHGYLLLRGYLIISLIRSEYVHLRSCHSTLLIRSYFLHYGTLSTLIRWKWVYSESMYFPPGFGI